MIIVGFRYGPGGRRLFRYETLRGEPEEVRVKSISPYLVEGPVLAVEGRRTPISATMAEVGYGSLPSDGGGLVVEDGDVPRTDQTAMKYIRPYLGSREVVRGLDRWCLWMPDGPEPGDLRESEFLRERLALVREKRLASRNPDTQALAEQPYKFFHTAQPEASYIGIPAQVSSTRRFYTVAFLPATTIASNTLYTALDPDGFLFGVLSSSMFIAWAAGVGGRLKTDLRYSKSITHNTFPIPAEVRAAHRKAVIDAGQDVLRERGKFPDASLADLYDPLSMPAGLVSAHRDLDRAVDGMFGSRVRSWTQDRRTTLLLRRYEELVKG